MSRSKDQITSNLLACLLLLGVMGCGGSPKQPPPVLPQNANPPAPAGPIGQAGGAAGNGSTSTEKPNSGQPDTSETEPPGLDDYILSSDQIVTEVENPKPKAPPAPFEVTPSAKGIDSSNLILVAADSTQTPDASGSNFRANPPVTPATAGPADNAAQPKAPTTGKDGAASEPWALPEGFNEVPGSSVDAETGLPLRIRAERDPVDMVLIPPGAFFRGADVDEPTAAPRHTVLMEAPYYIDTVEVTVARYGAFREFYRKTEGRKFEPSVNHDGNPEFPAVGIKFFDAKFYAKWTSKELPTESQWERAARGDQGHNYPWGDGRPIFQLPRSFGQITQVATFPGDRSPFGVYDMAGNAREWCLDVYQADIYQKEITAGAGTVRNPVGPKTAPGIKQQVIRGSQNDWAVWHRTPIPQNETAPDISFRCVVNLAAPGGEKSDKPNKTGTKKPDAKKKAAGPKF